MWTCAWALTLNQLDSSCFPVSFLESLSKRCCSTLRPNKSMAQGWSTHPPLKFRWSRFLSHISAVWKLGYCSTSIHENFKRRIPERKCLYVSLRLKDVLECRRGKQHFKYCVCRWGEKKGFYSPVNCHRQKWSLLKTSTLKLGQKG